MGTMHPQLEAMFEQHVCSSLDKQLHFNELIQGHDWMFDMETGRIRFGENRDWTAQVLGTESTDDRTWLWAWADIASDIPGPLLESANILGEYGREHSIHELGDAQFTMNGILSGEMVGMIASGVCAANAYFKAAFEGGFVYLLVKDAQFPPNVVKPIKRIVEIFPQAVHQYAFHHRSAFIHYAAYYGLRLKERGPKLVADAMRQRAEAEFDEQGRLVKIERFRLPGSQK